MIDCGFLSAGAPHSRGKRSRQMGVPVDELHTEPSVVVHQRSARRLGYGEIAGFATIPAVAPEIRPEQLKKTSAFRLIGKD